MAKLNHYTNPFAEVNQRYNTSRSQAKQFIMNNLFWSERTYYRKMNQRHELTDCENEVIATAFKKFIHEPLMAVFETATA